jgi:hypothetical protein
LIKKEKKKKEKKKKIKKKKIKKKKYKGIICVFSFFSKYKM